LKRPRAADSIGDDPSDGETIMQSQAAAMKTLLSGPGLHVMPGAGDGMGARLVEEAGFRVGFASGSSISALRLAQPDMDLLSASEMRDAVETIAAAAPKVLWLADGDTGYGNALNVQRTIRSYSRTGAAAVLIEDKAWPRPLGHKGAKLVVERDEALARCRAAREACSEAGLLLLARSDARPSRGFDEARWRIEAFAAIGADILFLDSPQSEEEIRLSLEAGGGTPMMAVNAPAAKHFMPPDATLAALGMKIVVYPQEMLAASVQAMRGALASLQGGPRPAMADPAALGAAVRLPEYLAADARLATPR
jgi:2-methylisocitrate lyase-like PEP mutase family enzyme